MEGARPVRAARGTKLTAQSWATEAPLRMLMNNLDPENAERPDDLVVYGGTGRAARDWKSFDAMVRTLTTLEQDETMLVQSGRPVGVFQTHEWAPRVLIANSNLVGDWATWPEFRRLEHLGLTMYGQMTAGSWIYIGTQGIVQGTYETFAAVAEKRFDGTLAGTLTLTAGCGGMGGAQPLAVTMNEGACLIVDVDPARLHRRVEHRYLDEVATDLDDAIEKAVRAKERAPRLVRRGRRQRRRDLPRAAAPRRADRHRHRPDLRARPAQLPARRRRARRVGRAGREEARGVHRPGARVDGHARAGHGRVPGRRRRGLRLRQLDPRRGASGWLRSRLRLPRLRPGLHPAALLRGQGPVPLGGAVGRPEGHRGHRPGGARPLPRQRPPAQMDPRRAGPDRLPGPACPHLLARLRRARQGRPEVQRHGRLGRAVGARSSSAATTSTRARWPAPTARPSRWPTAPTRSPTGRCSTPCSTRAPARAGCRSTTVAASASAGACTPVRSRSPTARPLAAQKLARVLTNDPGTGVIRHVDAGYDIADRVARERGVRIPMQEG